MLLSVVIPAHDEEPNLRDAVTDLTRLLAEEGIAYEIIIVDDNSADGTARVAGELAAADPAIRVIVRTELGGFGRAVRSGLARWRTPKATRPAAPAYQSTLSAVATGRRSQDGSPRWRAPT